MLLAFAEQSAGPQEDERMHVVPVEEGLTAYECTGRTGRVGDGAIVIGSSFSLDGVHGALALRVGEPR